MFSIYKYLHPFLILLCSLTISITSAQSTLTGVISDEESSTKLIGATVYLPDLQIGNATNSEGKFTVRNIPKGLHKIQVSYLGYETHFEQIIFTNTNVELNISLTPTVTETHEIVISGGYMSSQDENAIKIEVVGNEDVLKSGSSSLIQALEVTPGVNQISTGVGIGKPVVRGLSSNRVLVVYDDIRRENQQWGSEHGMGIDEYGVESTEIIKGPASLIYGSDALGGVLHFIRERNAMEGEIKGDAQLRYFSNTSGNQAKVGVKGNNNGITWSLRGSNARHSDYSDGNSKNIGNSRFNEQYLSAGVGLIRKWGIIQINYDRNDQDLGLTSSETVDFDRSFNTKTPYQNIVNEVFTMKNSFFINKIKLKLNLSRQLNDRKEYEEAGLALHMNLDTYTSDLKVEYALNEKNEFILGTQAIHQTNNNFGEEILIPDAETNTFGFYGLIKSKLGKRFNLLTGLRYDLSDISTLAFGDQSIGRPDYNFKFSSYSAALGGTYEVNKRILLRANVARAFRSPNLSELTSSGVHEGANRFELGNPDLTNENNLEFDFSTHIHSDHINAEIAGFYNYVENFITLNPTQLQYTQSNGEVVPVFIYSQKDAVLYGGEFSFDLHPHPLDWLHYEVTFETVTGISIGGSNLPLMPANSMYNEIRTEFDFWELKKVFFNVGLKYVFDQNKVDPYEQSTPGYELLNAGFGFDVNLGKQALSFGLIAQNLLNKTYVSHLSRLKTEGIFNQGRNFTFYIKIPFNILTKKE